MCDIQNFSSVLLKVKHKKIDEKTIEAAAFVQSMLILSN